MQYKLIVLDLDGTLTNSEKEITPRTKAALMQAQEAGVKVILASGRPVAGIAPLAEELQLKRYGGFILAFNGGKIIDCKEQKTVCESILPGHLIPELHRIAGENGVTILSYNDRAIITENPDDPYVAVEANLNKMPVERAASFPAAICFPVPKCLIVGDAEKIVRLETLIQQRFGGAISAYRSEPFFLEVMPLNIDKAQSLGRLLDLIGIGRAETIACGDGYNDLTMIRFAGLGVAMANAQPAVREAADYITLSNEEDGVAQVVDKFVLHRATMPGGN